jgi:hypothetical protein
MKIRSLALAGLFIALSLASAWATTITENFSTDPLAHGWKTFGNTNLFVWNSTNQNVEVTWDSTNQNSYLALPLGTVLARTDAFSLSFDLTLTDAAAFNYGQQLAIGLFNWTQATNAGFSRPAANTPNLFEFDYFPDTGFGDSVSATLADMSVNDTNSHNFYFSYDNRTLTPGVTYHVTLFRQAGLGFIQCEISTNGVIYTTLPLSFAGPITDFRFDTLSISSYADDGFGDSILAHGVVDNFSITLPPPPVQNLTGQFANAGTWQCSFAGLLEWRYTLQRSADLANWTNVTNGIRFDQFVDTVTLDDNSPPSARAFYRVSAVHQP